MLWYKDRRQLIGNAGVLVSETRQMPTFPTSLPCRASGRQTSPFQPAHQVSSATSDISPAILINSSQANLRKYRWYAHDYVHTALNLDSNHAISCTDSLSEMVRLRMSESGAMSLAPEDESPEFSPKSIQECAK